MKVRTSVTLSADLIETIAREARPGESRSEAIERLLREGLAARAQQAADARDLALLDAHADELNAEAADALTYQLFDRATERQTAREGEGPRQPATDRGWTREELYAWSPSLTPTCSSTASIRDFRQTAGGHRLLRRALRRTPSAFLIRPSSNSSPP